MIRDRRRRAGCEGRSKHWRATAGLRSRWCSPALSLIVSLGLAGCTVYSPAQPDDAPDAEVSDLGRPSLTLPPEAWPPRDQARAVNAASATPREVFMWKLDGSRPESAYSARTLERVKRPDATISHVQPAGVGLIRVFGSSRGRDGSAGSGGTTRLRFVSFSMLEDRPGDQRAKWFRDWLARDAAGESSIGWPGVRLNDPEVVRILGEGLRIRIMPPPNRERARGTLLYLAGLGSSKYEQPLIDRLRADGWWLVQLQTPSVWWFEDTTFAIESRDDLPKVAQRIARVVDDVIAEPAFAAEAVMQYIRSERPDIPATPLALVGCSAGALMATAVGARLGNDLDAAVLIGGGANLLRISQESDLTNGGITLRWPGGATEPPDGWLDELYQHYLAAARMDPYHTAAAMRSTPSLAMLANMDTIVPASSGRLLWERLGKPERYQYTLGHSLMFYTLSAQTNRILRWLGQVADSASTGQAAAPLPREPSDPRN
jgi:hypothetical protein